jgi:N-acetylmuramoyl-L-alanine amidase
MAIGHQLLRLFAVLSLVLAPAVTAAEPVVHGVRLGLHDGKTTRIVIDVSEPVQHRVVLLANPYRVVIELPAVEWRVEPGTAEKRGLVASYRFGQFSSTQARIVLDLTRPVRVSQNFTLGPEIGRGYRLVVDIAETSENQFNAAREIASAPIATPVLGPPPAGAGSAAAAPVPARKPPAVERPGRKDARPVIVIDPGHGGIDPGAISATGLYEKNVTLQFGRELKGALEAGGKVRALLTRERDEFVRLRDRIQVARDANAQLFVSVHADSIKDRTLRGASVYTLSENASDDEAAALAQRENRADVIAGLDLTGESDDVTNILIDLTQRETMNLSARYANILLGEFKKSVPVLRKSHRFAGFAVLKAPDVPSVLVELGYLSNGEDERTLATRPGRKSYVEALARAIEGYFAEVRAN